LDWGTLKRLSYPKPSEEVRAAIAEACPLIEEYYSSCRASAGELMPEPQTE
jgi:hypothetical protein